MVASGGVLSEGYGHGRPSVCSAYSPILDLTLPSFFALLKDCYSQIRIADSWLYLRILNGVLNSPTYWTLAPCGGRSLSIISWSRYRPLTSTRMFEPRHNIFSNIRTNVRECVVTWLEHSRKNNSRYPVHS